MNFLITNTGSFKNKGCEATTKAIINEITKLQNESESKIFTGDPEYDVLWTPESGNVSFLTIPFRKYYVFGGVSFFPKMVAIQIDGPITDICLN